MSAALLAKLIESGTPAELVAEVAMELGRAQAVQEVVEKKRAYDREYQRERRASRTTSYDSNDIDDFPPKVSPQTPFPNPPLPPVISDEITPPQPENDDEPSVREEHVLEAWNTMADRSGLPKARMTPERRKKLKTFIRRHTVDDITEAIWAVPKTPFLCGENGRGWKANFDFFLQPSSFTKLLEGTYG